MDPRRYYRRDQDWPRGGGSRGGSQWDRRSRDQLAVYPTSNTRHSRSRSPPPRHARVHRSGDRREYSRDRSPSPRSRHRRYRDERSTGGGHEDPRQREEPMDNRSSSGAVSSADHARRWLSQWVDQAKEKAPPVSAAPQQRTGDVLSPYESEQSYGFGADRPRDFGYGQQGRGRGGRGGGGRRFGGGDGFFDHRSRNTTPSKTIVARGLGANVTEIMIADAVHSALGSPCKHVKIIHDAMATSQGKGMAFIDFEMLPHAQCFFDAHKDSFIVGDRALILEYSFSTHGHGGGRGGAHVPGRRPDWICDECNTVNFARRSACFSCGVQRTEQSRTVGGNAIPTNTIMLVTGLDEASSEQSVRRAFTPFVTVQTVTVVRDPGTMKSRGMAFVEFFSETDAFTAMSNSVGLQVDGRPVRCALDNDRSKPEHPFHRLDSLPQNRSGAAARVIHSRNNNAPVRPASLSAAFVWEPATGMWFDATSQYAFDPNTQLYKHRGTGQAFRWDVQTGSYVQATAPPTSSIQTFVNVQAAEIQRRVAAAKGLLEKREANAKKALRGVVISASPTENTEEVKKESVPKKEAKPEPAVLITSPKPKAALRPGHRLKGGAGLMSFKLGAPQAKGDIKRWSRRQEEKQVASAKQKARAAAIAAVSKPEAEVKTGSGGQWSGNKPAEGQTKAQQATPSAPTATAKTEGSPAAGVTPKAPRKRQKKWLDMEKNICLLCKRRFKTNQLTLRHEAESELHKKNLDIHKFKQMQRMQRMQAASRARKVREESDSSVPQHSSSKAPKSQAPEPLNESNVGFKLLKKMQWTEGKGLGKKGQGTVDPVKVARLTRGAGLGSQPISTEHAIQPGDTYHECVRKRYRQRFDEIKSTANVDAATLARGPETSPSTKRRKTGSEPPQANAFMAALQEYNPDQKHEKPL